MRRNLRLDWRALALLGALLSIIIDWPGLVYAMPTILPPVAEVAAPAPDTLNLIKNDKILNLYPFEEHDREHHVRPSAKDEFTGPSEESSSSFPTNRPFSDVQTERTSTKQGQQPDGVSVSAHKETISQQERHLTTNEKQEVNENLNSISHKQLNSKDAEVAEAESEASTVIHNNKTQQNSHETQTTTTTTAGADEGDVSSTNTHIADALTPTTSSPLSILSSIITTTTESSAKIQSTLMPTTIIDNDKAPPESEIEAKPHNILSTFQFSSSHHLAILSRTERSIRSSSSSASTMNTKHISGPSSTHMGGGGGTAGSTGMVRRSSDMSGGVKTKRLNNSRNLHNKNNLDRNERSTVSHLSGPSRKIQLYIKNRFLQLMPDGTVNGSPDELSEYTILQRSTVDVGRIKIQGVATCLYLCMDPCGAVYGSKDFTDDCVFNENMEQHNYNTYSSTYNSNARRKYFLALNRHGEPRKLQIPPTRSLGKLATYTNAITETVPQERVEQLIAKNFGANRIKHGIRQLCDIGKPLIELIDSKNFKAQPKCNPNSNSNSNSHSLSNSNSNNSSSNKNNKNSLSSSSSSLVSSNSGQLLNNVPAANDKRKLSNSSSSSSSSRSSNNSNSKPETNSSSTTSHSSISNSQNNGHISNSSSSSSSTTTTTRATTTTTNSNSNNSESSSSSSISTIKANSHSGDKGKKLRKCRPHENEEEHNCHRRPHPLRNPGKQRRCKELLLQQQQAGVADIVLPPMCKKKGPKKQGAKNKRPPGEARAKNGLGTDGMGPNNRRGKKLNGGSGNGRQPAKANQNGNGGGGGGGVGVGQKKKQKNANKRGGGGGGGGGGVNGNKRKQQKTSTTTSTTTEQTSTSDATSTLKSGLWETSSFMPSSTLFETYDPHAESTSDRGDREQRNVRYANSMEGSMEASAEDTSAANDDNEEDEDVDGDAENVDDNEDASYEDDSNVATSSHMPYAETDAAHIPLTGGADYFLYYDQLDV